MSEEETARIARPKHLDIKPIVAPIEEVKPIAFGEELEDGEVSP